MASKSQIILTSLATIALISFWEYVSLERVLASTMTSNQSLSLYMAEGGKLAAFQQTLEDFSQIGIKWGDNQEVITNDRFAHSPPQVYEHQVVWSAQKGSLWQIFLFDALSEETQQLTFAGNNVNPQISSAGIVWEGQINDQWQTMVYVDGQIFPISDSTGPVQDLQLQDNLLAYSQKSEEFGWQVYLYNLETRRSVSVTPEGSSYTPEFVDGRLRWKIPLYQNGIAWGEMDLATEEVVVADTPAELDELYDWLFVDASASANLEEKYGQLDELPLLESLQVLGIIDEGGRVVEEK